MKNWFKTRKEATTFARKEFARQGLDPKLFKIDIWENIGWHFAFASKQNDGMWRIHVLSYNNNRKVTEWHAFVDVPSRGAENTVARGRTVKSAIRNALKVMQEYVTSVENRLTIAKTYAGA